MKKEKIAMSSNTVYISQSKYMSLMTALFIHCRLLSECCFKVYIYTSIQHHQLHAKGVNMQEVKTKKNYTNIQLLGMLNESRLIVQFPSLYRGKHQTAIFLEQFADFFYDNAK